MRKFGGSLVDAVNLAINPVGSIAGFPSGGSVSDFSDIQDILGNNTGIGGGYGPNTEGDNKKNILYIGLGIVALIAAVFFVTKK